MKVILGFLSEKQQLQLQLVNKWFYDGCVSRVQTRVAIQAIMLDFTTPFSSLMHSYSFPTQGLYVKNALKKTEEGSGCEAGSMHGELSQYMSVQVLERIFLLSPFLPAKIGNCKWLAKGARDLSAKAVTEAASW